VAGFHERPVRIDACGGVLTLTGTMMARSATPGNEKSASGHQADLALGVLEDYIGYHLRLAQNASFRAFQRKTGQADLKPGWFAVLSLIGDNPGIIPMALARGSGRDKSTLTPVIREMMKGGFVERSETANDRRSYGLKLTGKGRERLALLAACAAEHDARLDAIVGEAKAELLAVLRRIAAEIE
jgi:DNA-binding MarR family transcriptional regulator